MSRDFAAVAFVAILAAEVLLRIAQAWERIGRAVAGTCPCPEGCS